MKKRILMIFLFVTMFFLGNIDAKALSCAKGEGKCTDKDAVQDLINKEINTEFNKARLICLYEVTSKLDNKIYYTYIYYHQDNDKLYGASTRPNAFTTGAVLNSKGNAILTGDAIIGLNQNYECPTNSYIEYDKGIFNGAITDNVATGTNMEICFDNGDKKDCRANGKQYNDGTNFYYSKDSELILDEAHMIKYKDLGYNNVCNKENLPEGFNNDDTMVCTYAKYTDNGTQYIALLQNGTSQLLIKNNNDGTKKILFDDVPEIDRGPAHRAGVNVYEYKSEMPSNLKECPQNIYQNEIFFTKTEIIEEILDKNGKPQKIEEKRLYHYNTFNVKPKEGAIVTEYPYFGCTNGIIIDESIYDSCEKLINGELKNILDYVMSAIRIGVPILLIILLSYDITTAVIAGDDKVKKIKGKIIKRIIIAIVIFFVPTLINFVFNMVNEVWQDANYSTCGIAQATE